MALSRRGSLPNLRQLHSAVEDQGIFYNNKPLLRTSIDLATLPKVSFPGNIEDANRSIKEGQDSNDAGNFTVSNNGDMFSPVLHGMAEGERQNFVSDTSEKQMKNADEQKPTEEREVGLLGQPSVKRSGHQKSQGLIDPRNTILGISSDFEQEMIAALGLGENGSDQLTSVGLGGPARNNNDNNDFISGLLSEPKPKISFQEDSSSARSERSTTPNLNAQYKNIQETDDETETQQQNGLRRGHNVPVHSKWSGDNASNRESGAFDDETDSSSAVDYAEVARMHSPRDFRVNLDVRVNLLVNGESAKTSRGSLYGPDNAIQDASQRGQREIPLSSRGLVKRISSSGIDENDISPSLGRPGSRTDVGQGPRVQNHGRDMPSGNVLRSPQMRSESVSLGAGHHPSGSGASLGAAKDKRHRPSESNSSHQPPQNRFKHGPIAEHEERRGRQNSNSREDSMRTPSPVLSSFLSRPQQRDVRKPLPPATERGRSDAVKPTTQAAITNNRHAPEEKDNHQKRHPQDQGLTKTTTIEHPSSPGQGRRYSHVPHDKPIPPIAGRPGAPSIMAARPARTDSLDGIGISGVFNNGSGGRFGMHSQTASFQSQNLQEPDTSLPVPPSPVTGRNRSRSPMARFRKMKAGASHRSPLGTTATVITPDASPNTLKDPEKEEAGGLNDHEKEGIGIGKGAGGKVLNKLSVRLSLSLSLSPFFFFFFKFRSAKTD